MTSATLSCMTRRRCLALLPLAVCAFAQTAPKRKPDVPYVPTTEPAVQAMMKLGDVTASDVLYDLGCGDGRLVIAAAKLGARGVGIDINPERIKEARENARKAGVEDRVKFIEADLFEADIHQATVVTLFLLPEVNLKLKPKLLKDLAPGTRIVSNTFDMGDWKPEKQASIDFNDDENYLSSNFMLWRIPAKK